MADEYVSRNILDPAGERELDKARYHRELLLDVICGDHDKHGFKKPTPADLIVLRGAISRIDKFIKLSEQR